jgi:hypothetical protein
MSACKATAHFIGTVLHVLIVEVHLLSEIANNGVNAM